MQKIFWEGISTDDRMKSISDITSIVQKFSTLINFQKFSDISLNLILEVDCEKLTLLWNELSVVLTMSGTKVHENYHENVYLIFFNITFAKGSGDLELEVPNIPK
jgi:hypothetical protein